MDRRSLFFTLRHQNKGGLGKPRTTFRFGFTDQGAGYQVLSCQWSAFQKLKSGGAHG